MKHTELAISSHTETHFYSIFKNLATRMTLVIDTQKSSTHNHMTLQHQLHNKHRVAHKTLITTHTKSKKTDLKSPK